MIGRGMSFSVEGSHDRWFGVSVVLHGERICVMVKVCSLYYHSTSPFLAHDGGMTKQDDHQLTRVAGVCRKFCLLNPAFRGTPLTDFSFGVFSRSLFPTKGNP